jgi:protoporphyrinogen oxidase
MDPNSASKKKIAVIGGGVTGITAAMHLSQSKHFKVTLFEASDRLGGLSSYYQWEDVTWDRFYHVILSTDTVMLDLIKELGLQDQLFWRNTRTGFYGKNRLVSMSSSMDFLRFPFMSFWQKFRMGLGIIYSSQIKNPTKLDRIYAREWLTRIFGRRVYENIWEPLLRSKLGTASERTSAAFIWATINRLYGARNDSGNAKKEQMGHIHGGYHTILSAAEKRLVELGVELKKGMPIKKITLYDQKGAPLDYEKRVHSGKPIFSLQSESRDYIFDNVLVTIDCPKVLKLVDGYTNDNQNYWRSLESVNYLGVICVFLVLDRQLSPFYVINLLDKDLPFTGIIEATNVVSPVDLGCKHLVYLPKYVTQDDPIKSKPDEEITSLFIEKLKKVFPQLDHRAILHSKVFRAGYVQPLQEINFLNRSDSNRTPIQGLYVANTSMIYNSTLNNNAAAKLARKAASTIIGDAMNLGHNPPPG